MASQAGALVFAVDIELSSTDIGFVCLTPLFGDLKLQFRHSNI